MDESKFIRKPQPSIEEQNLGGINKSMEDELEKYDRLLAKEGISDGERKAYEDNKQKIEYQYCSYLQKLSCKLT